MNRSRRIPSDTHPLAPNEIILHILNLMGCLLYVTLTSETIYQFTLFLILYSVIGRCIGDYFPIVGDMMVNIVVWLNNYKLIA